MPRFYASPEAIQGKRFFLSGSEAHHAVKVLRKKIGDVVDLFDGKDASFRGRIEAISDDTLSGVLVETKPSATISIQVTLYQALIKGPRWDWLLEKVCEIGVWKIVPVITQRTVVKIDKRESAGKEARWNRIALAASKQCGRAQIMEVASPVLFPAAVSNLPAGVRSFIPWEKEADKSIQEASRNFEGSAVAIFVGPEGGWENSEVDLAARRGVIPVRLGPTLLRSETASLVAATLIMRELGVYS